MRQDGPLRSALKPHFDTLGSVLTGAWGQAAVAISGPLVARLLGVRNRGELALLLLIPLALCQVGSLGLPHTIPWFGKGQRDRIEAVMGQLLRPVLVQLVLLTVVHAVVLLVITAGKPAEVQGAALITMLIVPSFLLQQYGLAVLQAQLRFRLYYVLSAMPATGWAVAVLICLIAGFDDLRVVTAGWVLVNLVVGVVTISASLKGAELRRQGEPGVGRLLRFGAAGLLGSVGAVDNVGIEQLFAGLFLSPASLGLYVVGVAFTNLPRTVGGAIGLVCYPKVAAERELGAAWRRFWHFLAISALACILVAAALSWSVPLLIPMFFGDDFRGAVPLAQVLLLAGIFQGIRRTAVDGLKGLGRPIPGTVAEIVSLVSLFSGLFVLAPARGVSGVALAYTVASGAGLAFLALAILRLRHSHPVDPVDLGDEQLVSPAV